MNQIRLLVLAAGIAVVGVACHTHHDDYSQRGHGSYRVHEPAGAVVGPYDGPYGHYDEHGVGRQHHRHYYRYSH